MISSNNHYMLGLLADALHGRAVQPMPQEQWEEIWNELCMQCVFALPSDQLLQVSSFPPLRKQIMCMLGRNLQIFYSIMETQKTLLACLEQAQIPVVILKGAAAAVYYPAPDQRCMGDIDILVPQNRFADAYNTMVDFGYHAKQHLERYERHISFRSPEGIEIELHNYFSSSDSKAQNQVLDNYLFRAIDRAETVNVCGYETPILPPQENGLVLLGHINQHLRGGLGLRQIVDWMLFVEAHLDDQLWQAGFAEAAEQIGMKRLAMITTAMCRKYLGLRSDLTWCDSCRNDSLCDELMEYILAHGNFGRKDSTQSETISVLRFFRNPIQGLKAAQTAGQHTWKALERHHWLRPFAWLYQLCRWTRRGAKQGVDLSYLSAASQTERQETDFLRRLGVTRI